MKIARKHIENFQKGKVVGEEYYPLGHTNFSSLINKIKVAKPDCIYAVVVGGSNVAFYKQLKAAGITGDKQFLLTHLGDRRRDARHRRRELRRLLLVDEVLPVARQREQQEVRRRLQGEVRQGRGDRRRDAGRLPRARGCGRPTVEKAGSFDVDKVAAASPGIEFKKAPEGYVKLDENHHLWSKARIGDGMPDGQFKVVAESPRADRAGPVPQGLPVSRPAGLNQCDRTAAGAATSIPSTELP